MQLIEGQFRLSASDLMRFKGCRHATTLDLRRLEVGDLRPDVDGEEAALLQAQGDAHELGFLDRLKSDGRDVVEISIAGRSIEECVASTMAAMRSGADVIFQGAMLDGAWGGYSDFLEKVDVPSALGNWSYEVVDTKLKRRPDPKHVLQLCLYSDMLTDMQGRAPEHAHLELGDGTRFSVRLDEVSAYARRSRMKLQQFLDDRPPTDPEPVAACALCRWKSHCEEVWQETDSLALVANITRVQRDKLRAAGIDTMSDLSQTEARIPRMTAETWSRLRTQARLQVARRAGGEPDFVLRTEVEGRGFDLLPQPDEGDLFYDIEGDPYYPDGGLEYLHGIWLKKDGEWQFVEFWAHDRDEEAVLTRDLLDFLSGRGKTRRDRRHAPAGPESFPPARGQSGLLGHIRQACAGQRRPAGRSRVPSGARSRRAGAEGEALGRAQLPVSGTADEAQGRKDTLRQARDDAGEHQSRLPRRRAPDGGPAPSHGKGTSARSVGSPATASARQQDNAHGGEGDDGSHYRRGSARFGDNRSADQGPTTDRWGRARIPDRRRRRGSGGGHGQCNRFHAGLRPRDPGTAGHG